jgi:streptogramin lyase
MATLMLTACASAGSRPPASGEASPELIALPTSSAPLASSSAPSRGPLTLDTVTPVADRVVATFDTATQVCDVIEAGDFVWASDLSGLLKIDPSTNTIVSSIELDGSPCALAFADGSLFVAWKAINGADSVIARVDPQTGEVMGTLPVPFAEIGRLSVTREGELWAVNDWHQDEIVRIDPASFEALPVLETDMLAAAMTVIGPYAWVSSGTAKELLRIETGTGEITRLPLEVPSGDGISGDETGIWTVGLFTKQILLIDYPTGRLRRAFDSPSTGPPSVTVEGRVWASVVTGGLLVLNATMEDVELAFAVDSRYFLVSYAAGDVWLHGIDVPLLRISSELN